MKNKLGNSFLISILFTVILLGGCGGGGKGSSGITAAAVITPTYNGADTYSVDVVRSNCLSSDGTIHAEYFADHGATVTINAGLINPSNTNNQMKASIDRYTIEYHSLADSPGAPPVQSDTREKTVDFVLSGTATTSVNMSVVFVDLLRKQQYLSDVPSGSLNNYTATYLFEGHGENGQLFTFSANTNFQIGSFNNCPSGTDAI